MRYDYLFGVDVIPLNIQQNADIRDNNKSYYIVYDGQKRVWKLHSPANLYDPETGENFGIWQSDITYNAGDFVVYNGTLYKSKTTNVDQAPSSNLDDWQIYPKPIEYYTITDPAVDAAVTQAIIDAYDGVIITTTGVGNSQELADPSDTTAGRDFTVVNNNGSTNDITVIGSTSVVIEPGKFHHFKRDGTERVVIDEGELPTDHSSLSNLQNVARGETRGHINDQQILNLGTPKQSLAPAGTTQTINFDLGSYIELDVTSATGDVTLTLSNPVIGATYSMFVIQGSTARNIIFPVGSLQSGGASGNIIAGMSDITQRLYIMYDGTNYLVSIIEYL